MNQLRYFILVSITLILTFPTDAAESKEAFSQAISSDSMLDDFFLVENTDIPFDENRKKLGTDKESLLKEFRTKKQRIKQHKNESTVEIRQAKKIEELQHDLQKTKKLLAQLQMKLIKQDKQQKTSIINYSPKKLTFFTTLQPRKLDSINYIAYSGNGKLLATTHHDWVHIYDATTYKCIASFQVTRASKPTSAFYGYNINCLAFSHDSQFLLCGGNSNILYTYSTTTLQLLKSLQVGKRSINSLTFSHNGKLLAVTIRHIVYIYHFPTYHLAQVLQEKDQYTINSLAFSSHSAFLAVAKSNKVYIYNTDTYQPIKKLQKDPYWIGSVAFSSNSQYLACAGYKNIHLYNTRTYQVVKVLKQHNSWIKSIAFSSNGQFFASGGTDKSIQVYDGKTYELLKTGTGHTDSINKLSFSANSQYLSSTSHDNTVRVWTLHNDPLKKINAISPYYL